MRSVPRARTQPRTECCKLRLPGIRLANAVEFVRGFSALQTQRKVHTVERAEVHRTASSRSDDNWYMFGKLMAFTSTSRTRARLNADRVQEATDRRIIGMANIRICAELSTIHRIHVHRF
jgi:hypothetical protein